MSHQHLQTLNLSPAAEAVAVSSGPSRPGTEATRVGLADLTLAIGGQRVSELGAEAQRIEAKTQATLQQVAELLRTEPASAFNVKSFNQQLERAQTELSAIRNGLSPEFVNQLPAEQRQEVSNAFAPYQERATELLTTLQRGRREWVKGVGIREESKLGLELADLIQNRAVANLATALEKVLMMAESRIAISKFFAERVVAPFLAEVRSDPLNGKLDTKALEKTLDSVVRGGGSIDLDASRKIIFGLNEATRPIEVALRLAARELSFAAADAFTSLVQGSQPSEDARRGLSNHGLATRNGASIAFEYETSHTVAGESFRFDVYSPLGDGSEYRCEFRPQAGKEELFRSEMIKLRGRLEQLESKGDSSALAKEIVAEVERLGGKIEQRTAPYTTLRQLLDGAKGKSQHGFVERDLAEKLIASLTQSFEFAPISFGKEGADSGAFNRVKLVVKEGVPIVRLYRAGHGETPLNDTPAVTLVGRRFDSVVESLKGAANELGDSGGQLADIRVQWTLERLLRGLHTGGYQVFSVRELQNVSLHSHGSGNPLRILLEPGAKVSNLTVVGSKIALLDRDSLYGQSAKENTGVAVTGVKAGRDSSVTVALAGAKLAGLDLHTAEIDKCRECVFSDSKIENLDPHSASQWKPQGNKFGRLGGAINQSLLNSALSSLGLVEPTFSLDAK
jgi:hypothetical protein